MICSFPRATRSKFHYSACSHAIQQQQIFEVPNALEDERFCDNPLVIGDPNIRFYAGTPLITPEGQAIGMLCVTDRVPRQLSQEQPESLAALGRQVVRQLELRLVTRRTQQENEERTAELIAANRELHAEVAERKQAEASLRQAEEKYRNIFENVVEGIFRTTPDGNYIIANPALARMYGYDSPEELITSVANIQSQLYVDPNRREEFKRALEKCNAVFGFESRIYRKDRSIIWISENARAVCDDSGKLLFYEGTTEDITERKKAEDLLRESMDCFSGAFEHAPIGVSLVSPDGRWLKVNRALCEMVGYSEAQLLASNFQAITHPEDLPADLVNVRRTLDGEISTFQMEKRYIHGRGHVITALLNVSLVRDGQGLPRYFISQIQDITERKRADETKLKLEEQLRQTQKMDAIGQLAGGVAHDFNNQLNIILGYADMLKSRLDQPRLQQYVENIYIAARRSADLTKNLLAFARKGKYQSLPVNIHKVILETIEMLERTIDKRIVLKQVFRARMDVVAGDPSQLQNALLNLAVNARDAMAAGGDLVFETENVELDKDFNGKLSDEIPPGNYLKISVSDTGCGMSDEVKSHLFEPFFTTKPVGKGTGLGLASVYGAVKSHKGAIDVYSETGHGSTFKLYLPIAEQPAAERKKEDSPLASRQMRAVKNLRVLLVEDEEILRIMFGDMLCSCGIEYIEAENGRKAVDVYQQQWQNIDLVMLDMIMPEMDGPDAFRAMKKINPNVKVLLSTGFSLNSEVQAVLDEGVAGFIQKPFTRRELIEKTLATMQEATEYLALNA